MKFVCPASSLPTLKSVVNLDTDTIYMQGSKMKQMTENESIGG